MVLAEKKTNLPIKQSETLSTLQQDSPFSIEISAKNLTDIYSEQIVQTKTL
jgi:hypothetical protein